MLQYPSIASWRKSPIGEPCIAFYKYDGSNLRWEYSPKNGWHKFGTRRQMFDNNTPLWNQAIDQFQNQIGPVVVEQINRLHGHKVERITAFTEFYGPSSFAGNHILEEPKQLKLFDVFVIKKGFIAPRQFIKMFSKHDWSAEVVYQGNMSREFIDDVRTGMYPVYEGVICKGSGWTAKIKTLEYLERLRNTYEGLWNEQKEE